MSKIRFSLAKQLVIITLSSLLLMIGLISLVLPKSLESFFERTVYSYLDKPLEGFGKDRDFMIENENIIYIQNINGEFISNDDYRGFLKIESLDEIVPYLISENGKFVIKGSTYYYSVKKTREFRMIAITNDSYIKELRNNMLYITIPVVTLIFLIILVLLLLWSNYLVKRIGRIKNKIDHFNNPDYKPNNKPEVDDELKLLNHTIDEMKDMIITKEKYEREMYQNISHDFKTPIMVVKSYIEAYNDKIEKPDKVIKVTEEEMSKLEKKVKKMLELNKVTYLKNNTNEEIDLKPLIENKIENYKVINKDLNYKFECDKNSKVKGTDEIWESVVDNILSNAVRYANKEIKITVNKNKIVFYNDGENIDEKIINKIFDSYVKGKKGEHGLGLSIVKKNLESLNYKVYAKNLKKGVEFIIERK